MCCILRTSLHTRRCEKCFNEYGWDWKAASKRSREWVCTHCRNICPPRAQCAIYRRTNERRRELQQRLREPQGVAPSGTSAPAEERQSYEGGKALPQVDRLHSADSVMNAKPLPSMLAGPRGENPVANSIARHCT